MELGAVVGGDRTELRRVATHQFKGCAVEFGGGACPHFAHQQIKDHGRIDTRRTVALDAATLLGGLRGLAAWSGAQSVGVEARREPAAGGITRMERRYFLSSLAPGAARLLQVARGHWAIENNLHWMLDVHFDEGPLPGQERSCPAQPGHRAPCRLEPRQTRLANKNSVRLRLKRAGWDGRVERWCASCLAAGKSHSRR